MSLLTNILFGFKFDDDLVDVVGNHNPTAYSDISYVSGKKGKATSFNGSSYIKTPRATELENCHQFTVSAWIKPSDISSLSFSSILAKWDYSITGGFLFSVHNSGQIYFFITRTDSDGGGNATISDGLIVNNVWQHVVGVYDGFQGASVDRAKTYINGVNQTQSEIGIIANATSPGGLGVDNYIGKLNAGTGSNFFYGAIDDLYVWNRALTDSEVLQLYNNGNGLSYPFSSDSDSSAFLEFFK